MRQICYTEGVILKKTISGEADVFVSIFTKDFGKLRMLAKGAKKINAKLAPHIDTLNRSEIAFVNGKELLRLTGAIISDYYRNIKSDYGRIAAGFFIAELADQLLEERAASPEEYRELISALEKLDNILESKVKYIPYIFAARFLSLLGYHPQLKEKNNENKLLRICLEYGYNFVDKIDLSSINMVKLRMIIELSLKETLCRKLEMWREISHNT